MDMNGAFVARMERQLKIWDAELAALRVESVRAHGAARAGYRAQIRDLRANRSAACRTLKRVRDAISGTP